MSKPKRPFERVELDAHLMDWVRKAGGGVPVFGVCRSGKVNAAKAYMSALRNIIQVSDKQEEDDS